MTHAPGVTDSDGWTSTYRGLLARGAALTYPSETLVRLLKGNYIPGMPKTLTGMSVLDVSTGTGNNMVLFASLGMTIFGTEVSEELCSTATQILSENGIGADIRVGSNRDLPFDDNCMDFLVSWNVLHYESNEADILAGIQEYARVLKPGGRLLLSTTGPEHKILKDSETLGGHRYRIGRSDDFRKGSVYFYFDAENYLHHYFQSAFSNIMTGRTQDCLFTGTLDWFLVTGKAMKDA